MTAKGNIVSLDFSYAGSGMRPYTDYRFYLREEDGAALFDARCYAGKDFTPITVEKAAVSRGDIDAIIEICGGASALAGKQEKYAAASPSVDAGLSRRKIRDRHTELYATDGPHHSEELTAKWENGAALFTSPPDGTNKLVLFNYLEMLAIRLALPPAEKDVVSVVFYGRDGLGNEEHYRYQMFELDGRITFYAHYAVGYERRELLRVAAAREDMEALRAICGRYTLAGAQQAYRPALPPDFEPGKYEKKQTFIEVDWSNGAVLNASTTFGSEQALKAFFYDLAIRLEKRGS